MKYGLVCFKGIEVIRLEFQDVNSQSSPPRILSYITITFLCNTIQYITCKYNKEKL